MEENTTANGDYGYFGKGDTGYAQYMTAFNRNFGGSSGGDGGGNHNNGGGGGETTAAAAASSPLRWWSCWCSSPWEAEVISTVQGYLRQANYDIKAIFCCFDARTVRACQEKP